MKKRALSVILAFTMAVSACISINISTVFAASDDCGANGSSVKWSYNSSTATLTITGTGAIKDYGTTTLNRVPWYNYKSNIANIVVNEGVTQLGQLCFYNLPALTSVTLPNGLLTIRGGTLNYGAFRECTALRTISLPSSLTTIEAMAFRGCAALTSIRIPDSVTSIGAAAFRDCTSLATVTFGTGLTSTGLEAFYDSGVRTINFSSTITAIDSYSFFNTKVASVEIPETVESIGTRAFANCNFLTRATVYNASCEFKGVIGEDPFNKEGVAGSAATLTMYGHSGSTTQTYANEKGYQFVSIDPCEHINTSEVIVKYPTCTEVGITTQVCDDCGFVKSQTQIPAGNHDWELFETDDETENDGHIYKFYSCTVCNEEKCNIEHKAFVDGYYDYSNTATCDEAGLETYTCNVDGCGKVERHIAQKGNHKVDNYVVTLQPTCTVEGSKKGTCTDCGAEVVTAIPALGHTNAFVENLNNVNEDGHTYEIYRCSVCSELTAVPTHVSWVEGNYTTTIIVQPRCVINGRGYDACDICNELREVTLPANGEHSWYETSTVAPTCTAKGVISYACSNEGCNMTKTENIDALGHDYVLQENKSVPATCTTAGYDFYVCNRCSASNKDVISATGHTPDELNYTVITEADCENDGSAKSVCTVCGVEFDIVLEKLGHSFAIVTEGIEEKPGHTSTSPVCERCGYRGVTVVNHNDWLEGCYTTTVLTQGSCTVPTVIIDRCNYCSSTQNRSIPAPGHSYSYTRTTNIGELVYTCANCNEENVRKASTISTTFIVYINKAPSDVQLGYLYDLNGDNIINAKDYAIINKALIKENANK